MVLMCTSAIMQISVSEFIVLRKETGYAWGEEKKDVYQENQGAN